MHIIAVCNAELNIFRKDEICCPLPCRASSSHFAVNGLCHDYVLLGQPCKHTAQCIAGSECSKEKLTKNVKFQKYVFKIQVNQRVNVNLVSSKYH